MLTSDVAKLMARLARDGLAAASPGTPPHFMVKGWEALHAFEAWIGEQMKAVAPTPERAPELDKAATENLPEGPQG